MPNTKLSLEHDLLISDKNLIFWEQNKKARMLKLWKDTDPEDPRTGYDNVATMACFQSEYNLGDKLKEKTPGEFWDTFLRKTMDDETLLSLIRAHKIKRFAELAKMENADWNDPANILELFHEAVSDGKIYFAMDALKDLALWLPLYLYDHSGLTISCGERVYPYNDRYDSSKIGWIIMSKDTAIKELGANDKNWQEKAMEHMEAETMCYDNYLTGDVWGYTLYTSELTLGANETNRITGNEKPVSNENGWAQSDSCTGFDGCYLLGSGIPESVGEGLEEALTSGNYWTGKTGTMECYIRSI